MTRTPTPHVPDYYAEPARSSRRLWRRALIGFGVGVAVSFVLIATFMEVRPNTVAGRWVNMAFFALNTPWLWLWDEAFLDYAGKEHDLGGMAAFLGLCWGIAGVAGALLLHWIGCLFRARKCPG